MAVPAVDTLLAGLTHDLDAGHFESRAEEFLDETFRNNVRESFYSKTLAEKGHDAAEEQLAEYADKRYLHLVADAVSPIAAGIAKVIATAHSSVRAARFEQKNEGGFPFPYGVSHAAYGIVLYSPQVPGCGCMQPRGANKFAPGGDGLQIQAYVVLIDPFKPTLNSVAFMLPVRETHEPKVGYVALTLERDGLMTSERKEINIHRDAALVMAFEPDKVPFGVTKIAGGRPCQWLGFPGADEYVVSSLGELAEYLDDVAAKLSSSHEH